MAEGGSRARFARQISLAGIGEEGQRRIERATARVPSRGLAGDIARAYVSRAGVGDVAEGPAEMAPSFVITPAAREVAEGSLVALREIIAALGGSWEGGNGRS